MKKKKKSKLVMFDNTATADEIWNVILKWREELTKDKETKKED